MGARWPLGMGVATVMEPAAALVPLFVSLGPADQVAKHLSGVALDEISDLDVDPFRPTYTTRSGGRPSAEPASQSFWVASDPGTGLRSLTWNTTEGDWAIVIMNADGSPTVDVDLTMGGTLPQSTASPLPPSSREPCYCSPAPPSSS